MQLQSKSKFACLVGLAALGFMLASVFDAAGAAQDDIDSGTGGAKMQHREDIINSLPKMPEPKPTQKPQAQLQIGIKKRADDCERKAQKGDSLHMHYRGTLKSDGTEFDSSYKRGEPLIFTLGIGQVIKGWDQGLMGICAGEVRKLIIPSHLAYGEDGSPPTIPPGAALVFEVEAVKVEPSKGRADL